MLHCSQYLLDAMLWFALVKRCKIWHRNTIQNTSNKNHNKKYIMIKIWCIEGYIYEIHQNAVKQYLSFHIQNTTQYETHKCNTIKVFIKVNLYIIVGLCYSEKNMQLYEQECAPLRLTVTTKRHLLKLMVEIQSYTDLCLFKNWEIC